MESIDFRNVVNVIFITSGDQGVKVDPANCRISDTIICVLKISEPENFLENSIRFHDLRFILVTMRDHDHEEQH